MLAGATSWRFESSPGHHLNVQLDPESDGFTETPLCGVFCWAASTASGTFGSSTSGAIQCVFKVSPDVMAGLMVAFGVVPRRTAVDVSQGAMAPAAPSWRHAHQSGLRSRRCSAATTGRGRVTRPIQLRPSSSAGFGEAQLRQAAQASNGDPIPRRLSLYVHVPFCMSPCFYCGCNRIITRDLARGETYLARLYREIGMTAELFDRDREVIQLHFGGGTPNFLSPAQMQDLVDCLRRQFLFSSSPERDLSIELDPRFIDPAGIAELAKIGFNRASLGVQDFNPVVQAAVNRIQGVEETRAVVDACHAHGFRSVNIDLIYGLPKQDIEGFARTLETVIDMRPDRLAVYGYAHLPDLFKAQRQIDAADLPGREHQIVAAAACDRQAHARRLRLHRHGSFRAARRRPCRRAGAGQLASQFHGLHHACRQRPDRPGRERDQPYRRQLQPEPARPARPGRSPSTRAACRFFAGCSWTRTTCCVPT